MYVVCKDYPVMDGEPHLGSMTECEEIWEKYEAEDLVIDQIFEEGGDYPWMYRSTPLMCLTGRT